MTTTELKTLLKLLRSQGVTAYKTPELELTLAEQAPQSSYKKRQTEEDEEPAFEDLTFEQQLMYSAIPPTVADAPEGEET